MIYLKFQKLNPEIKKRLRLRSENRFDLVEYSSPNAELRGFEYFVNSKDMLPIYLTDPKSFVNSVNKPKYSLVSKVKGDSFNITGIFTSEDTQLGYGYPSNKKTLGKKNNVFYAFKNDLYLIMLKEDFQQIEILIIPNGKPNYLKHYFDLQNGKLEQTIQDLRNKSLQFYNYD